MGREVRMVPADWQHPKSENGEFIPLFPGDRYQSRVDNWDKEKEEWERGEFPDYVSDENKKLTFEEWVGARPNVEDYMSNWPAEQRTHFMMYEDTTKGTPISPAFETSEELAQWLVDNNASAFGSQTGSYEGWLRIARGGWAPSLMIADGIMVSGVDFKTGE